MPPSNPDLPSPPSIVPRPRPGFSSSDDDAPPPAADLTPLRMALLAASMRAAVGLLCLGVALLYLPPNLGTPILSGVAILMVVNGCLATWRCGRREPSLLALSRALVWFFPIVTIALVATAAIFGPALLGPDWNALKASNAEALERDVTFEPARKTR